MPHDDLLLTLCLIKSLCSLLHGWVNLQRHRRNWIKAYPGSSKTELPKDKKTWDVCWVLNQEYYPWMERRFWLCPFKNTKLEEPFENYSQAMNCPVVTFGVLQSVCMCAHFNLFLPAYVWLKSHSVICLCPQVAPAPSVTYREPCPIPKYHGLFQLYIQEDQ